MVDLEEMVFLRREEDSEDDFDAVLGQITDEKNDDDNNDNDKVREMNYKCKICDKLFHKASRLETHFRVHTGERPFVCTFPLCDKSFTRSDHLSRHMRSHTGDRRHACHEPECGQSFITAAHLKRHLLVHTKEKPTYKCPTCSMEFPKKLSLRTHRLSEHGEAEFRCHHDSCSKVFPSKSKLDRHLNQHSSKRYQCSVETCGEYVSSFYDLRQHLQSIHGIIKDKKKNRRKPHGRDNIKEEVRREANEKDDSDSDDDSDSEVEAEIGLESNIVSYCHEISKKRTLSDLSEVDSRYHCQYDQCNRSFTMKKNLYAHIRAIHENSGQFQCQYEGCGQVFGYHSVLKRHIQNIHIDLKNPRAGKIQQQTSSQDVQLIELVENGTLLL